MPHIELGNDNPGIRGLLSYRPETAGALSQLAEVLLRGDNTLSRGERELIAAYVSWLNECAYCTRSHGATAAAQLPGGAEQVRATLAADISRDGTSPVSGKLGALLEIARLVQQGGQMVSEEAVAKARAEGATDLEIHDTVLIAAAFCMFNRYVDGLAAPTPGDPAQYAASAQFLVQHGYVAPRLTARLGHRLPRSCLLCSERSSHPQRAVVTSGAPAPGVDFALGVTTAAPVMSYFGRPLLKISQPMHRITRYPGGDDAVGGADGMWRAHFGAGSCGRVSGGMGRGRARAGG